MANEQIYKPGIEKELLLSKRASQVRRLGSALMNLFLFTITSVSTLTVLFIIYFIAKDAIPFFQIEGFKEFFTSTNWFPSSAEAEFGVLPMFFGTAIVTIGAVMFSVPLGVSAAVCLSDVMPFSFRQIVKPLIEILAAIPSVAYGFFALVIFAPLLQNEGGKLLSLAVWIVFLPVLTLVNFIVSDLINEKIPNRGKYIHFFIFTIIELIIVFSLYQLAVEIRMMNISSGTNAFNVSLVLGIMALPTIVSVSEDALQAVGRELREGSYALGATRAETIAKIIIPAGSSGILAAVILGMMRAVGETMVVWMASGNAAQIPSPWFNIFEPIRTLTATIAGDMGEADHVTGSSRYHVLFAMALCLLIFSFISNFISERIVAKSSKKMKGM
ncbi:MAG: PstC family ABC transporter permease [Candidatus Cloacimonetes bacterium]|nr:PstC family ABC transporter permease [Candidatus Cloacimonadota bacterium]